MDVVSRQFYPREYLIRLSFDKSLSKFNKVDSYQSGKGVYIKRDNNSLELALKKNILQRYFKRPIPQEFIEEIRSYLSN